MKQTYDTPHPTRRERCEAGGGYMEPTCIYESSGINRTHLHRPPAGSRRNPKAQKREFRIAKTTETGQTIPASMKLIPLSNSSLKAIVSDRDYKLVKGRTWRLRPDKRTNYAVADTNTRRFWMHRVIKPGLPQIDHKDRNGLNNQRSNLRGCTTSQNQANRVKCVAGSSRYKGVSWSQEHRRWKAAIKKDGQPFFGGHHRREIDAARAYNRMAKKLFGPFARINRL
jgi:HNH endonuclease